MQWLRWVQPLFKARTEISPEEVCSAAYIKQRARAVECYIACCLVVETVLAVLVCTVHLPNAAKVLVSVVVGLRILEIIQVTVNAAVFDRLSGRPDNLVASTARLLVLAFVNFIELCGSFGVIYAADYTRLDGAGQPVTAFYFSVITQLTIGYGDVYPTGYLRIVATLQGLAALLFVILVFARFVATLPRIESVLHEDGRVAAAERPDTADRPSAGR